MHNMIEQKKDQEEIAKALGQRELPFLLKSTVSVEQTSGAIAIHLHL